jgi:gamma-butyrobetaine dioxygenase
MSRSSLISSVQGVGARLATRSSSATIRVCHASAIRPSVASIPRLAPRRLYSELTSTPETASAEISTPESTTTQKKFSHSRGNKYRIKPTVSNEWLRDACPCNKCVDPDSGQKTFSTTEVRDHPRWKSATHGDDGSLTVVWAKDRLSGGEDHTSVYPASVLPSFHNKEMMRRALWDRQEFEDGVERCRISYKDWMAGGKEFWDGMAQLATRGLVFVYDVPQSETSVERIGEQIGSLQETFYGRTWDVVSKPKAENVAYTNQFLGLHQDLLYYPDTPRIQLLHCLDNDCDGGESLFSDGVYAGTSLLTNQEGSRSRSNSRSLRCDKVRYGYNKNGNVYSREHSLLKVEFARRDVPVVESVWWSPPFQIPFPESQSLRMWNHGARLFKTMVEDETSVFEYKMRPGECVIFDNWRVLHGRRQFNTSSGKRWLKGTYVADSVYTARYNDMPSAVSDEHALFTEREKESVANREFALDPSRLAVKAAQAEAAIKTAGKAIATFKALEAANNAAETETGTTTSSTIQSTTVNQVANESFKDLLDINKQLVTALLNMQSQQAATVPRQKGSIRTRKGRAQRERAKRSEKPVDGKLPSAKFAPVFNPLQPVRSPRPDRSST